MKKSLLMLLIAAIFVGGAVTSCKPELDPDPVEKPDPKPEPKPEPEPTPDPEPEPDPEPDPEPTETIVYYDNLDKVKSTSNSNYFDTWADCRNMVGTGISGVSYAGAYSSVRSSYPSTGYPGASGINGVYYRQEGSYTAVNGIALPTDIRTFTLSVGMCAFNQTLEAGKNFQIILSDEHGKKQHEIDYEVKAYGNWYLATCTFSVASDKTTKLNIKILAQTTGAQGRTDDLKLVATDAAASVSYDFGHTESPSKGGYAELPATLKANSDYKYINHRGTTYESKKEVRNYEACYDIRRHNPMWVAYPCHEIYWEGGYTRPTKDPWRPEPQMTESEQSIIYASDWKNWPWSENAGKATDLYQYWSPLPATNKTVIKGHLMRSAERGCGDSSNPIDLNVQSFYPTNIAPECYQNATADESHWEKVEYILPNKWRCSDTLYVVVGCVYEDESRVLYDACNWGTQSGKSKPCVVPTARYKLVLRTKSGSTGKPVWECSADELMAIGFWFPQNFTGEKLTELPPLSDYIYSVSDIEKKIGGEFSFFPLAPSSVKDSYNISDWPGLSAIAGN